VKITKAIEILEEDHTSQETGEPSKYQDAVMLGIEALKRIVAWRNDNDEELKWNLPGETED